MPARTPDDLAVSLGVDALTTNPHLDRNMPPSWVGMPSARLLGKTRALGLPKEILMSSIEIFFPAIPRGLSSRRMPKSRFSLGVIPRRAPSAFPVVQTRNHPGNIPAHRPARGTAFLKNPRSGTGTTQHQMAILVIFPAFPFLQFDCGVCDNLTTYSTCSLAIYFQHDCI